MAQLHISVSRLWLHITELHHSSAWKKDEKLHNWEITECVCTLQRWFKWGSLHNGWLLYVIIACFPRVNTYISVTLSQATWAKAVQLNEMLDVWINTRRCGNWEEMLKCRKISAAQVSVQRLGSVWKVVSGCYRAHLTFKKISLSLNCGVLKQHKEEELPSLPWLEIRKHTFTGW